VSDPENQSGTISFYKIGEEVPGHYQHEPLIFPQADYDTRSEMNRRINIALPKVVPVEAGPQNFFRNGDLISWRRLRTMSDNGWKRRLRDGRGRGDRRFGNIGTS
jgi:hypothetical protein